MIIYRALYFIMIGLLALSLQAAPSLEGEINGALYSIKQPEEANGKLILFAHGYRPESLPKSASYGAGNLLPETLLEAGWTLASTSYRRNGWIMEEAGMDLMNLLDYIETEVMQPTEVYLIGNSMGGGVITWLSENYGDAFAGGLCLGAYLYGPIGADEIESTELGVHFNASPQFPLLYLTNVSELEGPQAYIEAAGEANVALWTIDRFGHVNQNEVEQLAAFEALVAWVQRGQIDRVKDATMHLQPASTATITDGQIEALAQTLVEVYGNFISNVVPADMEALGIEAGDTFALSANGQTVSVYLGSSYQDVPVGEWVAFWNAEGYLLFCRNYKHAVDTLGLEAKNPLLIQPE